MSILVTLFQWHETETLLIPGRKGDGKFVRCPNPAGEQCRCGQTAPRAHRPGPHICSPWLTAFSVPAYLHLLRAFACCGLHSTPRLPFCLCVSLALSWFPKCILPRAWMWLVKFFFSHLVMSLSLAYLGQVFILGPISCELRWWLRVIWMWLGCLGWWVSGFSGTAW